MFCRGAARRMWASSGDHRARRLLGGEVRRCRAPSGAPSGAPSCLLRPIVSSWSASGGPVPDLEHHPDPTGRRGSSRRASTRGRPPARPTRGRSSAPVSSTTRLLVPSLNPMRFRGVVLLVVGDRRAPEPLLRPPERDDAAPDPGEVTDRRGTRPSDRWRTTGCARSPSLRCRVELVAAEQRHRYERGGLAVGDAERSPGRSNNDAPKPKVNVSDAGPRPSASPVSSGGASGLSLSVPIELPAVIRRDAAVQSSSSPHEVVTVVGDHVERREQQPVLDRRDDPGLVHPSKGPRRQTSSARTRGRGATAPSVPSTESDGRCASAPAPAVPRNARRLTDGSRSDHDPTTCFDTFESGSASASIAWASSLVSALVRSVYAT